MSAGWARHFTVRAWMILGGVSVVACAVWLLPSGSLPSGIHPQTSSPIEPSQQDLYSLRIALVETKAALENERKLASQLQRELQDASRQIDELSLSTEKLRALLRGAAPARADADGGHRVRPAPRASDVWQFASSGNGPAESPDLVRHRASVRPDARISPYTPGLRVAPLQPPGFDDMLRRDTRSRLAPMAAVAPPPAVSSFGAIGGYRRAPPPIAAAE